MSSILLTKSPSGALVPVGDDADMQIRKIKCGASVWCDIRRAQNEKFHRKLMSLFRFAYDYWEPDAIIYKGEAVAKEFDRFRKDLTILAGFYEISVRLDGSTRVEAKSLSYDSMQPDERERVYKAVLNTVWSRVMKHVAGFDNPECLDEIVERLLRYE